MPRLPSRIQGQPLGTLNLNRGNLPKLQPSIFQPGPAPSPEQFNRPGVSLEVARALNDLQEKLTAAVKQVKADPTANKNLLEQVTLNAGGNGGSNPTIINHQIGSPYRGYRICTVRNGSIAGHCALSPTSQYPASTNLLLWTSVVPFSSTVPVTADIEVWA